MRCLGLAILVLSSFPALPVLAQTPPYTRTEVIYGRKHGVALTMDVFKPDARRNGAGVIFVVSGGWYSSHDNITPIFPLYIQPFLDKGFAVFAVVHGSNPRFSIPEMLDDLHRAVRFIRHNANDYGVGPDHLGITGGSAGGHLSLMVGLAAREGNAKAVDPVERQSSRVGAVVSFYPPTDFLNWGTPGKAMLGTGIVVPVKGAFDFRREDKATRALEPILDQEEIKKIGVSISPVSHASKDDPPTLVVHGDEDPLVPVQQAEAIAAKLKEAGAVCELIVKKGGKHDGALVKEYTPRAVAWFETHLVPKKK